MHKILVIEDNEGNSKLYKDVLKSGGKYEVTIYHNADNILSILSDIQPHLVIMDIMLNGASGIDVMNKIKDAGSFNHIPFIAISAHLASEYKNKAIEAGFDDYMEKPIFLDSFLAKVKSMLRKNGVNLTKN